MLRSNNHKNLQNKMETAKNITEKKDKVMCVYVNWRCYRISFPSLSLSLSAHADDFFSFLSL